MGKKQMSQLNNSDRNSIEAFFSANNDDDNGQRECCYLAMPFECL